MIPVFVTSFGRYEMRDKCLVSLLALDGIGEITVIDNTGAFADLLPRGVERVLADNTHRQLAPWALDLVPHDRPYIVCDEDIEIDPDCPPDLVERLLSASADHPKVGLQIRTDDVPDLERYAYSLRWERSLNARTTDQGIIAAEVDTHFAMYRSPANPGIGGVRLAAPYQCRHQPWYNEKFTAEEIDYYRRTGAEWARTHSAGELCTPS